MGWRSKLRLRVLEAIGSCNTLEFLNVEDAEVESLCSHMGIILNSSSVADLTMDNCRLISRCFLNLASGLVGYFESNLKSLELYNAWDDSSAVKHVAYMINSAIRLETLRFGGNSNGIDDMDQETV
ncbi:hypothetical protein AXG93_4123s1360 [Marchantia polymorpha subsp. ruderalis]|uniref:Uncharacterized protein n=1 Tax=Marchantia polymorpha subsp. ruderalis TaxID=1480154 RepID=A0A176WL54_MARPO|nr:hypothetical protein AXG93_4123s1360 [Marchantia polymorpha subsp. ruderalis]